MYNLIETTINIIKGLVINDSLKFSLLSSIIFSTLLSLFRHSADV
jgi:hypothetical protein